MANQKPRTIGELRASGYQVLPVKEELRTNLIAKMRAGEELFPGIVGYEETVLPQMENAILSGQDMILLGERGQAKTRLIRSLTNLLDEEIPIIRGCEINDNPYEPICRACRDAVAARADEVEIEWLPRDRRYGEKLATPDVTIADLIGEVDPVKVAEGRYLSDELTIHYGLIPRTNRGVFAINELPDLAEKIQVGLFNILEERDVQVRGYQIRLPLDVYVLATANPEDYTNRGRIITPLKDRYGSQIRTHYPKRIDQEIDIMEAERLQFAPDEYQVVVPQFMKEVVAEVTSLARASADINQRSGVSVRVTISNYENVLSNAMRRAIRAGEKIVAPRVSDLPYILASTSGKIELETIEDGKEDQVVEKLVRGAVNKVFNRYFEIQQFDDVITSFKNGVSVEVGDGIRSEDYVRAMRSFPSLVDPVLRLGGENPATVASAMEFILEGLHVNKKLNKDRLAGRAHYRG